jgi:drug/metabolite transporter (DMT)-like permease
MNKLSTIKGPIFVFLSAIIFGSYGTWSKLIGTSNGVFYPGWTRALLISIILFPILLLTKQIIPIQRKDWKWISMFLIFTTLTQAPLFYAFNHMDVGTATLLFFVTMLLTMYIVGFFFLQEKLTKIKIVSFLLACLGLYVTFSFSITAFSIFAALMAVVNGIASGGEVAFSKKITGSYSSLYVIWLSWIITTVTNCIISVLIGEMQVLPTLNIYWLYQGLYAIAGIIGFWLIIEGFKYVEASIGGLIGLLEIVFSILFGFLIFNEILTQKILIGGMCVVIAAALPYLTELNIRKNKI